MSLKNALGGIALISGTAIGAAVLALPVSTAHMGVGFSVFTYVICCFFMTMGALYLLETNLSVGYETNLISMSEKTLGNFGKYTTWAVYLILLYGLDAAYLTGTGAWITKVFAYYHFDFHPHYSATVGAVLTIFVIFLGAHVTDLINRIFMIGLLGAVFTLFYFFIQHTVLHEALATTSVLDLKPIPLIITSFGSAIVVPSITEYLHAKPKQLVGVVLIGCFIPLIIYSLLQYFILKSVPMSGALGLLALQQGDPVTLLPQILANVLGHPQIIAVCTAFSVFALITSLLGVSLALFDFIADGLHLAKNVRNKWLLCALTFIPPWIFALYFPNGFVYALSFAGLFVAILLGILPCLMVYRARYHKKLTSPLTIVGGKWLIVISILFFVGVILIELLNQYIHFTR